MVKAKTTRKTILVVEDEPFLSAILVERLTAENFNVFKAGDGKVGLKLALEHHPDMILLDILMPVMDGLALLRKLREDKWGKNVPVIVLSNLNDSEHVFESLSNGALDYLVKSDFELDDIVRQVHSRLHTKPPRT